MSELDKILPSLLFIGGAPRSGTSLLQKILSLHSEVSAGPEFENMYEIAKLHTRMLNSHKRNRHDSYSTKDGMSSALRNFTFEVLTEKQKKKFRILSEKTPKNVLVFKELSELFPKAKFVFVLRDPRAVIASLKKVNERRDSSESNSKFAKNVHSDIELIRKYVNSGFKAQELLSDRQLTVKYEDLVQNSSETVRKVCDFLEISFEENMLITETVTSTSKEISKQSGQWYSKSDFDRKISVDSIEKWKNVLTDYEKRLIALNFKSNSFIKPHYDIDQKSSVQFSIQHYLKLNKGYSSSKSNSK